MSINFVKAMESENNWTTTENGADALKSTNNTLVDLFGTIGALRTRKDDEIINLFSKSFVEDKLLATKMSFYARDIRGLGLGERRTPRVIWQYLANTYPDIIRKNLHHIPHFGRWDDLFIFVGTPVEQDMWSLIAKQWKEDIYNMSQNKPTSLMFKWLKSVNASNADSIAIAKLTAKKLGISEKDYRQTLSKMRAYIDVVEKRMSTKEFNQINYSTVPSKAMMTYRNAFKKRDTDRFNEYMTALVKGIDESVKINASTLYPYEILESMDFGISYGAYFSVNNDDVLEEQWKALPNYINEEYNVLIMADTSGSMEGRPMCSSVGLALYFAERNHGIFHNKFMTFSKDPSFVTISGDTISEKIKNVPSIVQNTDIEKAFNMILKVCVENNLKQEDIPKALVIISDMEFDGATTNKRQNYYDTIKENFANHNYEIPQIIFWNVDSRNNVFHAFSDYKGVQLASGQSPSVFLSIVRNIGLTPYEAMLNTLNDSAYDCITI